MDFNLTIPVHETFQETIQGEGYWSGTPCDFIKLQGCRHYPNIKNWILDIHIFTH